MPSSLFIVAELSANHNGSLPRALAIVEAAAKAGADGFKVQTWTPGTMCLDPNYTIQAGAWAGHKKLRDLYEQAWLPWEWHEPIFTRARELGMVPFSAAFDAESVDFLETLGVDRHKVASFELVDIPLIRHMASKGKPMLISTGMAEFHEFEAAYMAAIECEQVVTWLRCVSAYPADASQSNLRTETMNPWGLSDHTMGCGVACAAVALGAAYIEKHLTLSRADGGIDSGFSAEPDEFEMMVREVRKASVSVGYADHGKREGEMPELRRSLWITRSVSRGEPVVFGENVRTARPALGLPCDINLTDKVFTTSVTGPSPLTHEVFR